MDIVSKNLEKILNVPSMEDNPPDAASSGGLMEQQQKDLITELDIENYYTIKEKVGIEDFSKMILMKSAQKAMSDHDELIDIMSKVDDSKAARMGEVAQTALSNAQDAAKALVQFDLAKQKMELEKQKIEIKNVTIQNNNGDGVIESIGSQKDILAKLKNIMLDEDDDDDLETIIPVE